MLLKWDNKQTMTGAQKGYSVLSAGKMKLKGSATLIQTGFCFHSFDLYSDYLQQPVIKHAPLRITRFQLYNAVYQGKQHEAHTGFQTPDLYQR